MNFHSLGSFCWESRNRKHSVSRFGTGEQLVDQEPPRVSEDDQTDVLLRNRGCCALLIAWFLPNYVSPHNVPNGAALHACAVRVRLPKSERAKEWRLVTSGEDLLNKSSRSTFIFSKVHRKSVLFRSTSRWAIPGTINWALTPGADFE